MYVFKTRFSSYKNAIFNWNKRFFCWYNIKCFNGVAFEKKYNNNKNNNNNNNNNNNDNEDVELTTHKKRYISPQEIQQIINELRLVPKKDEYF